ncbi:hypothetical protein [Pedobacter frigoris]|uniref:hypothetical protein n=1 Tax=Pedobacter frigoris TaxID=2571272 RepID=UPI00292D76BA|nr:hypothetical protein [Pedobacter frigoris]
MRIIIVILLIASNSGFAQSKHSDDRTLVHQYVLKNLKAEGNKLNVFPSTKKRSFDGFDFKATSNLDQSPEKPWNKKEWIEFLSNVDTGAVKDYPLKWVKKQSNGAVKTATPGSQTLIFAPALFSADNSKVLIIAALYSPNRSSGSNMAWYFERTEHKWQLKGVQTYLYRD